MGSTWIAMKEFDSWFDFLKWAAESIELLPDFIKYNHPDVGTFADR